MESSSLASAWAVVERSTLLIGVSPVAKVDAQVCFYMGVHAALSAQLAAVKMPDAMTADALACLQLEVEDFFDLFGLSTATSN
ncbi:hypothetical protein AX768_09120 [Burkholderia sp. PAMC 28687]|uniref:hypothetical protein n=1 Tax=Burkholderia sp. PAMC 28687 TaxID=1795874 RepID=UPI000781E4F8|nr:hypothetical protein [Burkholderia sp. PAMC 28687]AMM14230.1 hypothetical protein AX768_09120 [Burkholderia sp. PAMC 28687]